MPHWKSLLPPGKYVSAFELQGKDVTMVINKVTSEEIVGDQGITNQRIVIAFKGAKLPMVLNKTNREVIIGLYGNDYDKWIDRPITMYPTSTKMAGKVVDCIRLKAPRKQLGDVNLKTPIKVETNAPVQREPGSDDDDETPVLTK